MSTAIPFYINYPRFLKIAFIVFFVVSKPMITQAEPAAKQQLPTASKITPGAPVNFITVWNTGHTGTSSDRQITIPSTGSGYNYEVYWENVNNASSHGSISSITGNLTITFPEVGTYRIEISGAFPRIFFNDAGDKMKILSVEQWGNTKWTDMTNAFKGAGNIRINATDAPDLSLARSMSGMFQGAAKMNDFIEHWDVSGIENMSSLFYGANLFNRSLNSWDVGNVTNMAAIFYTAYNFNGKISDWNVSKVTNMRSMFESAMNFNQDLNSWNVSKVTSMASMFEQALVFNRSLNNWDVSKVTDMERMFRGAIQFNQNLSNWDVSKVTNMSSMFAFARLYNNQGMTNWNVSEVRNMQSMFQDAANFNQDLNNWDVSKATNMSSMFFNAVKFNGQIGKWKVSNVTDMRKMFQQAIQFNVDLNEWDVSKVLSMESMFSIADRFNGEVGNWNVSSVTNMQQMFASARAFNKNLNNWDVSHVTNMISMFDGANAFNTPLDKWNVSKVTDLTRMFYNAYSFNQNLNNWDVSGASAMAHMFNGARAFNQSLNNWDVARVTNMRYMFRSATAFNQSLSNWNVARVTDMQYMFQNAQAFNQDLNNWNVSAVSNMLFMFEQAQVFNGHIEDWDVSGVTTMQHMFSHASAFNQNLDAWDVSNVTDMKGMFNTAKAFNKSIHSWDVSRVTDMEVMFYDATAFNQDLGSWNITNVRTMERMLHNSGLSIPNYDATLMGWAARGNLRSGVRLGAGKLRYCEGRNARRQLINDYKWIITDDTKDIFCIVPSGDGIVYVDRNVFGGDATGDSWENAVSELADALQWTRSKSQSGANWNSEHPLKIFVARGIYKPAFTAATGEKTSLTSRENSFVMSPFIQLYGGFDPAINIKTLNDQRILPSLAAGASATENGSVLDGRVGAATNGSGNVYHVVITAGKEIDHSFLMDGFTIKNGFGNENGSIMINGKTIQRSWGAGWYNAEASPRINNVCITNTFTTGGAGEGLGAAMFNLGGSPTMSNMVIRGNGASHRGGGIFNSSITPSTTRMVDESDAITPAKPTLTNVIISGNAAPEGAGMYNFGSIPVLTNITISGNSSEGIFNNLSVPVIANSIIWGNKTGIADAGIDGGKASVSYSIVQGGYDGTHIMNIAPGFMNAPDYTSAPFQNGNYLVPANSPAFNAGDPLSNTAGYAVQAGLNDLAGNTRIQNGDIELGAYEVTCDVVTLATDQTSVTRVLSEVPNYFFDGCSLVATVSPNGSNSLTGSSMTAQVWIKNETIVFGNARYIPRHYDLTPTESSKNTDTDITLYYTQADFNTYNNAFGMLPGSKLPTRPGDPVSNVRIAQFRESYSVTGKTLTYQGRPIYLVPKSILWNDTAGFWEVTFSVTGFSGFFLTGQSEAVLPVTLVAFSAKRSDSGVQLSWRTSSESNSAHFEVQRSADSRHFDTINIVTAAGTSAKPNLYDCTDSTSGGYPILYYRLKMVDQDGTFAYSRIISVKGKQNHEGFVNVYPNPSSGTITIESSGMLSQAGIAVYDLLGKTISVGRENISSGKVLLNFHKQQSGTYMIAVKEGSQVVIKKILIE